MSGTLILIATFSVVRLWITFSKASAAHHKEEVPDDEDGAKGPGDEVILMVSQMPEKHKGEESGASDILLSVEELESIAADTFLDIERSPMEIGQKVIPDLS